MSKLIGGEDKSKKALPLPGSDIITGLTCRLWRRVVSYGGLLSRGCSYSGCDFRNLAPEQPSVIAGIIR